MCIRRKLFMAAFLATCSLGAGAQERVIKHAPARPTSAASGKEMFAATALSAGRDGKEEGRLPRLRRYFRPI